MRTFEERKEEIYRRSRERIARRKKTARILGSVCVVFVLITAVGVSLRPEKRVPFSEDVAPATVAQTQQNSLTGHYARVSAGPEEQIVTDPVRIHKIRQALWESFQQITAESNSSLAEDYAENDQSATADVWVCEITVSDETGTDVYRLEGNKLTHTATAQTVFLPEEAEERLLQAVGLS